MGQYDCIRQANSESRQYEGARGERPNTSYNNILMYTKQHFSPSWTNPAFEIVQLGICPQLRNRKTNRDFPTIPGNSAIFLIFVPVAFLKKSCQCLAFAPTVLKKNIIFTI